MTTTYQKSQEALAQSGNRFRFLLNELKPKGKIFTPFNVISIPIILLGIYVLLIRFTEGQGLAAVTNLTQEMPWGLWKAFAVVTCIALAGGAYVLVFMVYILNLKKYKSIVRVTVLIGFLSYVFYAGALMLDLGRPLNIINLIIGNNYGVSSVLFLVGWHSLLYILAMLLEFSPAVAEWLHAPKLRKVMAAMTLGAVIFGITLSVLHQSGIGALFLMAKDKIHPLWYNAYLPIMFVVSSVFAGLSLVIFALSISNKVFADQLEKDSLQKYDSIMVGLSKVCTMAMFAYFFMTIIIFVHEKNWEYLNTSMGNWYLFEVIGFIVLPMLLFFYSSRSKNMLWIRVAAIITLLGILLNRLNVSMIAFNWDAPVRYVPSWQEIVVTLTIILVEVWVFRWVVRRMPVLRKSPDWVNKTK